MSSMTLVATLLSFHAAIISLRCRCRWRVVTHWYRRRLTDSIAGSLRVTIAVLGAAIIFGRPWLICLAPVLLFVRVRDLRLLQWRELPVPLIACLATVALMGLGEGGAWWVESFVVVASPAASSVVILAFGSVGLRVLKASTSVPATTSFRIAVVGSHAKTTTAAHCQAYLRSAGLTTWGNEPGQNGWRQAMSAMADAPGVDAIVLEIGIDGPGDQPPDRSMRTFDLVVMTAVSSCHVGAFGSMERLKAAKARLCGLSRGEVLTTPAVSRELRDMWPDHVTPVVVEERPRNGGCDLRPELDRLSLSLAMATTEHVQRALGRPSQIDLSTARNPVGRCDVRALASGATVIDSSASSNDESLRRALTVASALEKESYRRIVVLCAPSEAGRLHEQRLLRSLETAARWADLVVYFGSSGQRAAREVVDAAKLVRCEDLRGVARWLTTSTSSEDVVVLDGSLSTVWR